MVVVLVVVGVYARIIVVGLKYNSRPTLGTYTIIYIGLRA